MKRFHINGLRRWSHGVLATIGERLVSKSWRLERLQMRLERLEMIEARVDTLAAAVSTWAVTSWIEQASLQVFPLVSVVLPTHNRSALLQRAINSVRGQVYPNWEVIIVDDDSTDDTLAVVNRFRDELGDDRVRAIKITHAGVCAARNAA